MSDMNLDDHGQPRSIEERHGDRITELWAWVTLDPTDDNEGVLGSVNALGSFPLIGADRARVEGHRELAQTVANHMKLPVELRRFAPGEVIETLQPQPTPWLDGPTPR